MSSEACIGRTQFVSDHLVDQIIEGRKTASVTNLSDVFVDEDEYNTVLRVGQYFDVYDSKLTVRCRIRVTGMELCRWGGIPERLWRGETNSSAREFREDHVDFFNDPSDDFEFIAYYFELVD